MVKHYHVNEGEKAIWHDGSLVDCPETVFVEITTLDGKPGRLARGMSVSLPPPQEKYYRIIENADHLE